MTCRYEVDSGRRRNSLQCGSCLQILLRRSHFLRSFFSHVQLFVRPWNSPGQNTGVGSLSLLQGDLPNPGIKLGSPVLQANSLPTELSVKTF